MSVGLCTVRVDCKKCSRKWPPLTLGRRKAPISALSPETAGERESEVSRKPTVRCTTLAKLHQSLDPRKPPDEARCRPLSPAPSGERVRVRGGSLLSDCSIEFGGGGLRFEAVAAPHPRSAKGADLCPLPRNGGGEGKYVENELSGAQRQQSYIVGLPPYSIFCL